MVRKMAYVGFSYLLGLLFASFFFFSVNVVLGAVFIAVPSLIWIFFDKTRVTLYVCCICFGIGLLFYSYYDRMIYSSIVKYNDLTIEMQGVITDCTEYAKDISGYRIKGRINGAERAEIICYGEAKICEIGDEIYVKGKISVPDSTYLFNAESYYKAKGIYLIINSADEVKITSADKLPLKRILCKYRDYIYGCMSKYLDRESFSVAKAMLFGDKSDIDDNTRVLLSRTGIGHIMSVSGVHLTIVCSLFFFLLRLLPINKYVRFFILLIPMFLFAVMAGMSKSVLRAAVMLILVYGSGLFDRRADVMNSLGIAAVALTVSCPFAVRDVSFMLSLSGVIGIGAAAPAVIGAIEKKRGKELKAYLKPIISSACVTAVIFPVSFMFFDEISVVSPFTNLLLLPFCTAVLICGVLTAATGGLLAAPLMKICGVCCNIVLGASEVIGGFQLSYIPLGYKYTETIILIVFIASAAVFAVNKNPSKAAVTASALFGLCIASIMVYRFLPADCISVAVLNNGKGSSVIVIHDKKNASVIDLCKGGKTADYAAKYLMRQGIGRVELLAMTVDDNTSGVIYMNELELFDVGTALLPIMSYNEDQSVSFALHTEHYDNSKECIVEMPGYTMILSENNTIQLEINGHKIIAYNGKAVDNLPGNWDAAVDYTGKSSGSISGDIMIFTDKNAEASVSRDSRLYIGENVVLNIYADKIETEVISCGFDHGKRS